MDQDVTLEMIEAGQLMASNLIDANISSNLGGLGGSKTWEDFLNSNPPNLDLINAYIDNRIVSVTAIYLAMDRKRKEV